MATPQSTPLGNKRHTARGREVAAGIGPLVYTLGSRQIHPDILSNDDCQAADGVIKCKKSPPYRGKDGKNGSEETFPR